MVELTTEELKQHFSDDIFKRISETADELGLECYVGGDMYAIFSCNALLRILMS